MHALITGASSGIDLELAQVFAADGYELTLVTRRRDLLEYLAGQLGTGRVVVVDCPNPVARPRWPRRRRPSTCS